MMVNGLKLPDRLINLIETGRWKRPDDVSVLARMTGAGWPEGFFFDPLDTMIRETAGNIEIWDKGLGPLYGLTSSSDPNAPIASDLLDVTRAVLIAGNHDEEAIALDYRDNPDEPKVMCDVHSVADGGIRWKVISLTFDEFADQLGL